MAEITISTTVENSTHLEEQHKIVLRCQHAECRSGECHSGECCGTTFMLTGVAAAPSSSSLIFRAKMAHRRTVGLFQTVANLIKPFFGRDLLLWHK